jgi:lysozyme
MTSAQGVDISSFQPPAAPPELRGLSFAFCKATNGLGGTDPDFAGNWAAIRKAGIHRGTYHEMTAEDALAQAGHFLAVVSAQGLEPGDMLAVVASDYSPSGAQVRQLCDRLRHVAGPRVAVLVYSDLSRLPDLWEAAAYPLWLAYYGHDAPASVAPWDRWAFWQWSGGGGTDGGDSDSFNGTPAQLDAWIASYAGVPPAPPSLEAIVTAAPTVRKGDTGQAVKDWQGLLNAHGHLLAIDGNFGVQTEQATVAFQRGAGIAADGIAGPATLLAALKA